MARPPRPPPKRCPTCGGSGKQYAQVGDKWVPVTCRTCGGSGRVG